MAYTFTIAELCTSSRPLRKFSLPKLLMAGNICTTQRRYMHTKFTPEPWFPTGGTNVNTYPSRLLSPTNDIGPKLAIPKPKALSITQKRIQLVISQLVVYPLTHLSQYGVQEIFYNDDSCCGVFRLTNFWACWISQQRMTLELASSKLLWTIYPSLNKTLPQDWCLNVKYSKDNLNASWFLLLRW